MPVNDSYPLVAVTYQDIVTHHQAVEPADLHDLPLGVSIRIVGHKLDGVDGYLYLAAEVFDDGRLRDITIIPKELILEERPLVYDTGLKTANQPYNPPHAPGKCSFCDSYRTSGEVMPQAVCERA